ncbi:MAG TPA: helix-turn-helix domain-containing protein [Acidothermaceae bacterium]
MNDPNGSVDNHVGALGAELLREADALAEALARRIAESVPFYGSTSGVTRDQLKLACLIHIRGVFGPISKRTAFDPTDARDNGRLRAIAGAPLPAVMDAYRVGARFLWETLADRAHQHQIPCDVMVEAASDIWLVQDLFTQAMSDGYRDEMTAQLLANEHERSALVGAVLDGQPTELGTLWEAAEILGLPRSGPYVTVVAASPGLGRQALPRIVARLRAMGMVSAWRLTSDTQLGIVCIGSPERIDLLVDALRGESGGNVGVSTTYDDLREAPRSLRFARSALASAGASSAQVVVFDDTPIAVATVGAPEVMQHLARTVLADLDSVTAYERELLLDTFRAWVDSGGSSDRAAKALVCHPNTVRLRLKRLESHTGRSITRPRDVAELCLAMEAEHRAVRSISN